MLGLEEKDVGNLSVLNTYAKYGINEHAYKELKFE